MSTESVPPKKSALNISRILLLLILVAALGGLGLDQYSKRQMAALDGAINRLNEATEQNKDAVKDLTKERIQEAVGRQPTRTTPATRTTPEAEEYDFPGVFYMHRVTVNYKLLGRGLVVYDGHKPASVFRFGGGSSE